MKTIYLCGPIEGCTDHEAIDWRRTVRHAWEGDVLDPMRRDYRGHTDEHYKDIVELDKIDIAACDIVLANFGNYDKPSVGTCMEIITAWQLHKYVIAVIPLSVDASPWLRYHSNRVCYSLHDALRSIIALTKTGEI